MTKIDIRNNGMCADGSKAVAGALKGNNTLTELNIAKNNMTYPDMSGAAALADAIPDMRAMTSLNLSSNALGELVLPAGWTKERTRGHPKIYRHSDGREQKGHPGGEPEGIIAVANAIPNMGALTKFNISKCVLQAEGGKALATGLKGNGVITELNISENDLGRNSAYIPDTSGIVAIADAIPNMGALSLLNLSSNGLTRGMLKKDNRSDYDQKYLGDAWGSTDDHYESGDMQGVLILADAIKDMEAMSVFDLSKNDIGEEGAAHIAGATKVNECEQLSLQLLLIPFT
jgi:Ran GTPase-activating protein (RanGAP) involved in mRNA processing and transport